VSTVTVAGLDRYHAPSTNRGAGDATPPGSASVRTFPLRIAPIAGEALDSWLEAIAARHDSHFGEVLRRCAVPPRALRDTWLVGRVGARLQHLAIVTGVDAATILAVTQEGRRGSGADIAARLCGFQPSGWERRKSSRLCPDCLKANGGRWLSSWRLNWSFACVMHECLLADTCPRCHGAQRRATHALNRVPLPGRCAGTRSVDDVGGSSPCLADLGAAVTPSLRAMPSIVQAQQRINDVLTGHPVDLPIYRDALPHPGQLLTDIKVIARWAITRVHRDALCQHVPRDALSAAGASNRAWSNPSALEAAIAVTCAMDLLMAPNIHALTQQFRQLMSAPNRDSTQVTIPGWRAFTHTVRPAHDRACADVETGIDHPQQGNG
jgi:TniQ